MLKRALYTMRSLFRSSNTGIIVFFVLNFLMLVSVFGSGGAESLMSILVLYAISLLLAFLPIGTRMLCLINGARPMTRLDMRRKILPVVSEVYQKAKEHTPEMPDRIHVRIMYDPNPNAFAIGIDTICVTEGLLDLPEHQIAGILAHEMGHLALQHTLVQLLIGGGNLLMSAIMITLEVLRVLLQGTSAAVAVSSRRAGGCLLAFIGLLSAGFIFLWTKLCMLLMMGSSRANEYAADRYAYELGYGEELAESLDHLTMGTPQASMLKLLCSTHPEPGDRIGRLQSMGLSYSRY